VTWESCTGLARESDAIGSLRFIGFDVLRRKIAERFITSGMVTSLRATWSSRRGTCGGQQLSVTEEQGAGSSDNRRRFEATWLQLGMTCLAFAACTPVLPSGPHAPSTARIRGPTGTCYFSCARSKRFDSMDDGPSNIPVVPTSRASILRSTSRSRSNFSVPVEVTRSQRPRESLRFVLRGEAGLTRVKSLR